MPEITLTRQIQAAPAIVWSVLDDYGEIQRWSPGVKFSKLTSPGPVGLGSTRDCAFTPMGRASERIEAYLPQRRMTVRLFDLSLMPFRDASADFLLAPRDGGTELTFTYAFTPIRFLRLMGPAMRRPLALGLARLVAGFAGECERLANLRR